jgi:Uma2 family endonuclease
VAPALCIGIPSTEDTLSKTMDRMKDYFQMGLPTCWIVDPIGLSGWVARPGRLEEALKGWRELRKSKYHSPKFWPKPFARSQRL